MGEQGRGGGEDVLGEQGRGWGVGGVRCLGGQGPIVHSPRKVNRQKPGVSEISKQ